MDMLLFILLGIHWDSKIWALLPFANSENLSASDSASPHSIVLYGPHLNSFAIFHSSFSFSSMDYIQNYFLRTIFQFTGIPSVSPIYLVQFFISNLLFFISNSRLPPSHPHPPKNLLDCFPLLLPNLFCSSLIKMSFHQSRVSIPTSSI